MQTIVSNTLMVSDIRISTAIISTLKTPDTYNQLWSDDPVHNGTYERGDDSHTDEYDGRDELKRKRPMNNNVTYNKKKKDQFKQHFVFTKFVKSCDKTNAEPLGCQQRGALWVIYGKRGW